MDTITNRHEKNLKTCIITTGVSSLNYYHDYIQPFEKDNLLLYNCMGVSSIKNIDKVDIYNVIIDFTDNNIKEIVFELFNYLLPFDAELHVKVIYSSCLYSEDLEECMVLLKRLDKHELIELEIIEEVSEIPKKKESNSWIKKLKNTFLFTGSGNTGKTSLIATLSELCSEKGHRVALVDLTEGNKSINYFTNIYSLMGRNLQDDLLKGIRGSHEKEQVDVYTYPCENLENTLEEKLFYKSIRKVSSIYDYVFINTDINTVHTKSNIFNMGEKIFIIHDFMPTKINATKQILLKFAECGINTKGNISLIYNKIVKCYFNIDFIEERMIFKKLHNKKLMPLVDLNCHTFEIPYNKKTMEAMINHISHKSSIVDNVSYSYKKNIDYIYKYINNTPYVEIGDVDIVEYIKNAFQHVWQHAFVKNIQREVYKYMMQLKNSEGI
ncbi:MAG: hypothetical protein JJT76_14875 [Clostridiaceae bacterium]|nr:hypothetical protein [Clostridiaceae bacterium]